MPLKTGWEDEISIARKFDTHQTHCQTHTGSQANSSRNRQKRAERHGRVTGRARAPQSNFNCRQAHDSEVSHSLSHLPSENEHERATFHSTSDTALLSIRINSPLHEVLTFHDGKVCRVTKCFTFAFSTMNLVNLAALSTGLSHA
jgi:hypothetical protein